METDNVEDTPISFSCKTGAAVVDVWINETSHGVKSGQSMTATLTAGSTTSKVRGKTMPNEEAGTPSFLGTQPASDPLFAALSKEQILVFAVGAVARSGSAWRDWRQGRSIQAPLSEAVRDYAKDV